MRGLRVRRSDTGPVVVRRLKEDLRAVGEPGRGFPERRVEQIKIKDLPENEPGLVLGRLLAHRREPRPGDRVLSSDRTLLNPLSRRDVWPDRP